MKRLHSVDILRGFLMVYIIILHALIQRVFSSTPGEFETTVNNLPLAFVLGISPLILISLWGSAFTFLTGVAAGFQMGQAAGDDALVPLNRQKLDRSFRSRVFGGMMIYAVYLVMNLFFATQSIEHGFKTHSLLTGFFETLTLQLPTFFSMTATSTLETIAFSGIIVSAVLRVLLKRHRHEPFQAVRGLAIAGLAVLALSVILRQWLGDPFPHQQALMANGNYVWYFFFMRLYAGRFALFPVLAFGFIGAALGVVLSQRERLHITYKKFARFAFSFAGLFVGIFGLYLLDGFEVIPNFSKEFTALPMHFLNMGLQIAALTVLVGVFDYASPQKQKKRLHRARVFKNFNAASLTIFVFEPVVASGLYNAYYAFWGDISSNLLLIVSFMMNLLAIWWGGLKLWQRAKFVGSCEWVVAKGKKWLENLSVFKPGAFKNGAFSLDHSRFYHQRNMVMKH